MIAGGGYTNEMWEWDDGPGRHRQYDPHAANQCAVAKRAGWSATTLFVGSQCRVYRVDFTTMRQINAHLSSKADMLSRQKVRFVRAAELQ